MQKYRADIDGMRAIAVLSVIIFHVWPHSLSGGFVGVDVFFVISGYLITGIISEKINKGTFSFLDFYARRIKRILPSFYSMILLTLVLTYFTLLPTDYIFFVRSLLRACIYISNVFFASNINYFAQNSNEYHLLHTWSLSVEEQYYIFWPIILLLLARINNRFCKVLLISSLFMSSYLFSIYSAKYNMNIGYYSIMSRSFELMVGSILSFIVQGKLIKSVWLERKNFLIYNLISILGIFLIIYSFFSINEKTAFPSYIAIVPTLGAALIIYSGSFNKSVFVNRIISKKPFELIGKLSYSLYLFHWPLLASYRYYNPSQDLPLLTGLIIIAITFIISFLNYLYIETPIKNSKDGFKSVFIKFQIIPLMCVALLYGIVIKADGLINRIPLTVQKELFFLDENYCYDHTDGNCIVGDISNMPARVIAFGDSHAAGLFPFWDSIAKTNHFAIKELAVSACTPLINSINKLPSTNSNLVEQIKCSQQIQYISNHINDYDIFIIAGAWQNYLPSGKREPSNYLFTDELKHTINYLINKNKKVVIVGDVPVSYDNSIDGITTLLRKNVVPFKFDSTDKLQMHTQEHTNSLIQKIVKEFNSPNVYYLDIGQFMSRISGFPYYDNILMYKDDSHINQYGSENIAKLYTGTPQYNDILKFIKN